MTDEPKGTPIDTSGAERARLALAGRLYERSRSRGNAATWGDLLGAGASGKQEVERWLAVADEAVAAYREDQAAHPLHVWPGGPLVEGAKPVPLGRVAFEALLAEGASEGLEYVCNDTTWDQLAPDTQADFQRSAEAVCRAGRPWLNAPVKPLGRLVASLPPGSGMLLHTWQLFEALTQAAEDTGVARVELLIGDARITVTQDADGGWAISHEWARPSPRRAEAPGEPAPPGGFASARSGR